MPQAPGNEGEAAPETLVPEALAPAVVDDPAVVNDPAAVDDKVLALRTHGQSFAAIARTVGLEKAGEANRAFNRALRRRSTDQQDEIRVAENRRLDRMAGAVSANTALGPEEVDKRMRAIGVLRDRLMK
jgi:hypothetical protein